MPCIMISVTCIIILSHLCLICAAEEKEPFEAKAQQDKKRYKEEISGYKNPQPMNIESEHDSDSG